MLVIKHNGKEREIIAIYHRDYFMKVKAMSALYKGNDDGNIRLVWQAVRSCFGSGSWVNKKPWINKEVWKNR